LPVNKVWVAVGLLLGAAVLASMAARLLQEAAKEVYEIRRSTY